MRQSPIQDAWLGCGHPVAGKTALLAYQGCKGESRNLQVPTSVGDPVHHFIPLDLDS